MKSFVERVLWLPEPVVVFDQDFKLVGINESAEKCFGKLSLSNFIDKLPGSVGLLAPALTKTKELGSQQSLFLPINSETEMHYYDFRVYPVTREGATFFIAQGREMSPDVLQALDAQISGYYKGLSAVLAANKMGFWDWDIDRNYLTWDDTNYFVFEVAKESFPNAFEAWANCVTEAAKPQAFLDLDLALKGEKPFNTTFEILTPKGNKKIIAGVASVQRDETGKPLRMLGFNWDVTAEKKRESELKNALDFSSTVLTTIPGMVYIFDINQDRNTFVNESVIDFLGYTKAEIEAMPFEEFQKVIHPEDLPKITATFEQINHLRERDVIALEYRLIRKDGRVIHAYDQSQVYQRDAKGKPIALLGVTIDISEQKIAQDQAEVQKIKAFHSAKLAALGEMAGGVAHEINNPLAIIVGKVEQVRRYLKKNGILEQKVFDDLDKATQMVDRISKIVKGLRAVSRSSEMDPMSVTEVATLVEEVTSLTVERFQNSGVELQIKCEPQISVACRAVQIQQVIMNLLNNAFDALPKSNFSGKIELLAFRENEKAIIEIKDNGTGIPKNVQSRILEPFFTTKETGKGTGLGLSISNSIIQEHKGKLSFQSRPGETIFRIELPMKQETVKLPQSA